MTTTLKRHNIPSIALGSRVFLMGVVNITPDSLFDGGKYSDPAAAADCALKMEESGADIVDLGGESSRPGSRPVLPEEEIERIAPVLERLKGRIRIPISLDTSRRSVLEKALTCAKVDILNDIYALRRDPDILGTVIDNGLYLVLMHMQGDPQTMQIRPAYDNVTAEVCSFFEERMTFCVKQGLSEDRIILDPGIGFGKRLEDNLALLKNLRHLKRLGRPVLVGPSRKSFLGDITGRAPKDRLWGTAAAVTSAIVRGADIVRVHDVSEMKDVISVACKLKDHEC